MIAAERDEMSKEEIEHLKKILAKMQIDNNERWKVSMSLRLLKTKLEMEEDDDDESQQSNARSDQGV